MIDSELDILPKDDPASSQDILKFLLKNKAYIDSRNFKRKFPSIYEFIINKYDDDLRWKDKLYLYAHELSEPKKCPVCGKPLKIINFFEGYPKNCSLKCSANNINTRKKYNETCREKYGVNNPSSSQEVKEKTKQTNIKKFGGPSSMCSAEVRQKAEETNLKKYGAKNPQQNKEIKEKTKQTNREIYGCECTLQNKKVKEKANQTNIKRYGDVNPMKTRTVQNKLKVTLNRMYGGDSPFSSKEVRNKAKETYKARTGYENPFSNPEVQEQIKITMLDTYGVDNIFKLPGFNDLYPYSQRTSSKLEMSYQDFLEDSWYRIIRNDRDVLDGFELDILHVDYPLAIEINGMWWHCLEKKEDDKLYHPRKFIWSYHKGVEMITVWEDYDFDLSCQFIIDKTEGRPLDKYKKTWFPDLSDDEWPADMGLPPRNRKIIGYREHECIHGGHLCYDCGVFILEP